MNLTLWLTWWSSLSWDVLLVKEFRAFYRTRRSLPWHEKQPLVKEKKKQSSPTTRHEDARGERKCSSYSFLTSALDGGEWSASRPDRALPRGKNPRYPLYRRLSVPQSRSGHRGYRKNPLPLPGIEPRSPGRPVRSQTLYWLSHRYLS
jgi:hypothetical protein